MLSRLFSDARYTLRTLRRSPGFALAAIVPIALGIGINTGVFSIVESVVLRPLPVPGSTELVSIHQRLTGVRRFVNGSGSMLSLTEYERYRDRAGTLSGLMAYSRSWSATLGGESPRDIEGRLVTCNYFDVLRVRPSSGIGFSPDHCDGPAAAAGVVLSHELWASTFGSNPRIIGSTVSLNRQSFTVLGIAPEGFGGTEVVKAQFFAPIAALNLLAPDRPDYREDASWLSLVGRLADGVSLTAVRAELTVVARQLDREQPGRNTVVLVEPATLLALPEARGDMLGVASVMLAAFGLVLLIACANVANLLLARTAERSREIAIRLATGASRARLVQQLLTESVILAGLGGAAGVLLAWWSFDALLAFAVSSLPGVVPALAIDAQPNLTVLWFAIAVTVSTGVLFGLAPALQASRPDLHTAIKQAAGGSAPRTGWLRGALMSVQVAVCLALLIPASLLLRGWYAAELIEPGFDYRNVSIVSFDLRRGGYDDAGALILQQTAMERINAVPGILSVAQVQKTPLSPGEQGMMFRPAAHAQPQFFDVNIVSPEYFALLRIPISQGRAFTTSDLADTPQVVIVTEATARRYWPGTNPVGQTLMMLLDGGVEAPLQVVGVANDAQIGRLAETESSYVYLPAGWRAQPTLRLLVRSDAPFVATAPALRDAMRDIDSGLAVTVRPLEDNLNYWQTLSRLAASLGWVLGLLALALASIGVYGVVSYVVSRRIREVAIRMALGATRRQVQQLVLWQTMHPIAVGMAIGMAAAAAASQLLTSLLFGVSPLDPASFAAATLFLGAIAAAAGVTPTRRATKVDPLITLRYE